MQLPEKKETGNSCVQMPALLKIMPAVSISYLKSRMGHLIV